MKRKSIQKHPKVEKSHCCIFIPDGSFFVGGDCTFVDRKVGKKAIFEITLIKNL